MKVAYVVAAHAKLDQLERLLRRLGGEAVVVLHVDRQVPGGDYDAFRRRTHDLEMHHLERRRCFWGGFGVVRAALEGIRHLVGAGVSCDYVALLSGQDYPLRTQSEIAEELELAGGRSFLSYFPLPFAGWGARGGLDRVEDWHFVSHRALHLRLPRKRRIPGGLAPYGGGRPWLLERRAVEYVDEFARSNPAFVRFFAHALHPDELFFQTILLNSPLAETIVADHRQYVRWRGGSSPALLTSADLDDALASGCLFARKFDSEVDPEVLDRLDAHLDRRARARAV